MAQKLVVVGGAGEFYWHVHREGCRDLGRYNRGMQDIWDAVEYENREQVVEDCYFDQINEAVAANENNEAVEGQDVRAGVIQCWMNEFKFFQCVEVN